MAQALDSAAHRGVNAHRSCLQDEAADQTGIDLQGRLDLAARRLLDLPEDLVRLVPGQVVSRGQLDVEPTRFGGHEPIELAGNLVDLADPALLRCEAEEIAQQLVCLADELPDDAGLRLRIELRVPENG